MTNYLKPELLILVPVIIGLGQILKPMLNLKKFIPFILIGISIVISIAFGFISSNYQGWKMILDSVVITGLCHGLVAAFIAMGIYDTAKAPIKKLEG